MENASKALIIAGAILIAILIVSLGVLVFQQFAGSAREAANMDEQEIGEFNSKLTPYVGVSKLSSRVNALLQYCLSNNMNAQSSGEKEKIIIIKNGSGAEMLSKDASGNYNGFTRVETGYYKVEAIYKENGLITEIKITKN